MATPNLNGPNVITSLSINCLGTVCTVVCTDKTPNGQTTKTWTLTRNNDGTWTPPTDLSDATAKMLVDLAARTASIS